MMISATYIVYVCIFSSHVLRLHVHSFMPTIQQIKLGSQMPIDPNTDTSAPLSHRLKKAIQQACARGVMLLCLLGCCAKAVSIVAMSFVWLVSLRLNRSITFCGVLTVRVFVWD